MEQYEVGKDVISQCGKCKLALSHIIVAMKDTNTIAKVQCRTCDATHAFKDPNAVKVKKKAKKTRTRKKTVSANEMWTQQMAATTIESKKYSIKDLFLKGDLLKHTKFGDGLVQEVIGLKIEVLFENEIKTLVHGR